MSLSIDEILAPKTEQELVQGLLDGHRKNGLPVSSWLTLRNLGLSLTHLFAAGLFELREVGRSVFASWYLDTAQDVGLTRLAASQFDLERYPAVAARHYFLVVNQAGSPQQALSAGEVVAGTLGTDGILFDSDEDGLLPAGAPSGSRLLLAFKARDAGAAGNVPAYTALSLRTTLIGASIAAVPVAKVDGDLADPNGGVLYAALQPGYTVVVTRGAALDVQLAIPQVLITLGANTTAAQVVAEVNANSNVGQGQILHAQALGTGAGKAGVGTVIPSSSVLVAGQAEEGDDLLKLRCRSRWATLGRGGTEASMIYWALAAPQGYTASPVTKVRVYSNRNAQGNIAAGEAVVLVAGPAGALPAQDLAAVRDNFVDKAPLNTLLHVVTTTNKLINLVGTVNCVRAGQRPTGPDTYPRLAIQISRYQERLAIGGVQGIVHKQHIEGELVAASPQVVRNVILTSPLGDTSVAWNETATFSTLGLRTVDVDP